MQERIDKAPEVWPNLPVFKQVSSFCYRYRWEIMPLPLSRRYTGLLWADIGMKHSAAHRANHNHYDPATSPCSSIDVCYGHYPCRGIGLYCSPGSRFIAAACQFCKKASYDLDIDSARQAVCCYCTFLK